MKFWYIYLTAITNGFAVNRDVIMPRYWKNHDFESIAT